MDREEIVRACIAEMRAALASDAPQPDKDARVLFLSGVVATFKREPAFPRVER